ncbi:hypothetical protein ACC704_37345, partial [Rhizobium johnstonii]
MSAERSPAVEEQKRKGLRVAFSVSIGFTLAFYAGAIVPFLGPLFACAASKEAVDAPIDWPTLARLASASLTASS